MSVQRSGRFFSSFPPTTTTTATGKRGGRSCGHVVVVTHSSLLLRSLVVCNQTIYLFIFFFESSIKFIRTRHSAPVCGFINDWRPAVDHRKIEIEKRNNRKGRRNQENEPPPPHRSPHRPKTTRHFIIRCILFYNGLWIQGERRGIWLTGLCGGGGGGVEVVE